MATLKMGKNAFFKRVVSQSGQGPDGHPKTWNVCRCSSISVQVTEEVAAEPILGIPEPLMRRHPKTDLGFTALRPTSVNELRDDDLQKRQDACARILQVFTTITKRGDVLFNDEYATHRCSRSRHVYFCSEENPHFHEETEHNPPHVMIRAGI